MFKYRPSLNHNNAYQGLVHVTAPFEKSKSLGSRGSMVTSLELKGIDGSEPGTTRSGVCGQFDST